MKKTKIGQGYYPSAYGRGFRKNPIVWEINGKAYVKDAKSTPWETDLEGYIMVNKSSLGERVYYYAVGIISQHLPLG